VATFGCSTAKGLLDLYTKTLAVCQEFQEPILAGVMPGHPVYADIEELREQAHKAMLKARRIYWEHIQEHGCRAQQG
jgi:hypothetical protein